jgi:hypothetical protein
MKNRQHPMDLLSGCLVAGLITVVSVGDLYGQTVAAPEPLNWTAQQDHRNMMDQLGIKALRPGPSGRAGATNSANYDPAKANPYPDLPEPLMLKNG